MDDGNLGNSPKVSQVADVCCLMTIAPRVAEVDVCCLMAIALRVAEVGRLLSDGDCLARCGSGTFVAL